MQKKIIQDLGKEYDIKKHPNIKGVQIIEGKNNFPISWLNQQGYCEYQLYLQYVKDIRTTPTKAMKVGISKHNKSENEFKKDATPSTFNEFVEISKNEEVISREIPVIDPENGIRGYIDEIWMMPDKIVIIDDKPGTTPYSSTINQVRAYCLAIKNMLNDSRKIQGALRQRGTNNIFWSEEFNQKEENTIKFLLNRMDGLFKGLKPFIPTKNPNKCKSCRYKSYCEHSKSV